MESVRLLAVNAAGDVLGYDGEAGRWLKGAAAHDTMVAGLKDEEKPAGSAHVARLFERLNSQDV